MTKEVAFINVKAATRELSANAETHEKLAESLVLIEQLLFPERFVVKNPETRDIQIID